MFRLRICRQSFFKCCSLCPRVGKSPKKRNTKLVASSKIFVSMRRLTCIYLHCYKRTKFLKHFIIEINTYGAPFKKGVTYGTGTVCTGSNLLPWNNLFPTARRVCQFIKKLKDNAGEVPFTTLCICQEVTFKQSYLKEVSITGVCSVWNHAWKKGQAPYARRNAGKCGRCLSPRIEKKIFFINL